MKPSIFVTFFLIIFISFTTNGQDVYHLSTKSKKAIKAFNKSLNYIQAKDFQKAEKEIKIAIKADANFIEAHMLLGDINAEQKKNDEASDAYQEAIEIAKNTQPSLYFIYANFLFKAGKYEKAKANYQTYIELQKDKKINAEIISSIEKNIGICDFAIEAIKNPVPFVPINMGENINSEYNEYSPVITADDNTIMYTRLIKDNKDDKRVQEDFFISTKKDGLWTKSVNLGPPVNTSNNEGQPSLSPDGKILIFTACEDYDGYGNGRTGYGSCDIFFSRKVGNSWSIPKNIGKPINSAAWESQPSYASDGKTLYFVSNRKGGYGGSDIWKSTVDSAGYWGNPVNLGPIINTKGNEFSVFIHPDNQTLYFSSDGHPGLGGLDIFVSRKDASGNWTKPVNLGYPINTPNDEQSFFVNAKGNRAYFSSDKEGGSGGFDLYYFELYEEARPKLVTYLKGIVYDSKTNEKLEAKFELIDLKTGNLIVESYSDKINGDFLVSIPSDNDYALNVSKNGYLFYSENFSLKGQKSELDPFTKNIPLQPIEVGDAIILKNVFFDTDMFNLKDESLVELNKLVDFLNKNNSIIIEISGHTDNQGKAEHNKTLSENRAKAVYDYLVSHKISEKRLSYKGYGETRPIDSNDNETGRAVNRRTEVKIISR